MLTTVLVTPNARGSQRGTDWVAIHPNREDAFWQINELMSSSLFVREKKTPQYQLQ